VGREHYREFILPYERELVGAIRRTGVVSKLHICGNITHLLADIAEVGADMVDIDWMVDMKEVRRVFGPDVCLCGNFDPVQILLRSDPETVRQSCIRCIQDAGAPFVLAPGCEVPPDTPAENFAAFCEAYAPNPKCLGASCEDGKNTTDYSPLAK
jgi:uroporphyrinogen decarboxylase